MARLPFDQIDVLLIGELGKNYSGTGLDPNVIGRQRVETMPDLPRPVVTRLAVLDLSPETRGNALGIGLADLTTDRLVAAIDPTPMRVNCMTSNFLTRARVPLSLPTDREVVAACLDTCWRIDPAEARMVMIPNTLELPDLWVTGPLLAEAAAHPDLVVESDLEPIPFGPDGTLDQEALFPASARGRRASLAVPSPFDDFFARGQCEYRTDPAKILAVAFDLDGLMFDTEALFFRVASEMVRDRGKTFHVGIMRAMIGRQPSESGMALKTLAGLEEEPEVLMAEATERFMALVDTAVHPTPGLIHLLDLLDRHAMPLAVATSSHRAYAERLLGRHKLIERFALDPGARGRDPPQARPGDLPDRGDSVRDRAREPAGARRHPDRPRRRQGGRSVRRGRPARAQPGERPRQART